MFTGSRFPLLACDFAPWWFIKIMFRQLHSSDFTEYLPMLPFVVNVWSHLNKVCAVKAQWQFLYGNAICISGWRSKESGFCQALGFLAISLRCVQKYAKRSLTLQPPFSASLRQKLRWKLCFAVSIQFECTPQFCYVSNPHKNTNTVIQYTILYCMARLKWTSMSFNLSKAIVSILRHAQYITLPRPRAKERLLAPCFFKKN